MDEEEKKRRKRQYDNFQKEIYERQRLNQDRYDQSVFALSSAFLAVSIAFVNDVVSLDSAQYLWLLMWSWGLFAATVVSCLAAILFGQHLLSLQLDAAGDYYLKEEEEAKDRTDNNPNVIEWLNRGIGVLFALSIGMTVAFLILNIGE